MDIKSEARGHHIYKHVWTSVIHKELTVLPEESNIHDQHAVTVMKDGDIVDSFSR